MKVLDAVVANLVLSIPSKVSELDAYDAVTEYDDDRA